MSTNLTGQVALVCGGTGRIGSVVCAELAARGARVMVQFRSSHDAAELLVQRIRKAGGLAAHHQADITDGFSVDRLFQATESQLGTPHIMVNTVHGQFQPRHVADMAWADWAPHLGGLKAHFLLCKGVLPGMRRQQYGRIVYVSAGLSKRLFAGCSAYSTIKAGLNAFSKTLAVEEGKHGITVNIVAPGKVVPLDGRAATDNPEDWEDMNRQCLDNSPLGCPATSADVAQAVLFFASPQASGITGQTLFVAGGEIMP